MPKLLVTGSSGLVGSEVVSYFARDGWQVHGIDNNQRAVFFGHEGDTRWNQHRLLATFANFRHHELDITDRALVTECVQSLQPDLIVHTAAQPSHDLATAIPVQDFDVNANGTLYLLEAARQYCSDAVFVHMSTNKVYGDRPNTIPLLELESRWDYADPSFHAGITEDFPTDQSMHSIFGASKLAADVMVQEYGRYFGMKTCCLRGGCLTGPNHGGVELHGFLSYLIKCNVAGTVYKVYGYKGKQVRDNIHALDVARFIHAFWENPRSAEVYNLGGGRPNSCSILEGFERINALSHKQMVYEYVEENRKGDHICYISDLTKMQRHYPTWNVSKNLENIFEEIFFAWRERELAGTAKLISHA